MRRIRRYLKNKEGTAAIEFAILAIPFFMLLFAVLELAIVFFINSTLNQVTVSALSHYLNRLSHRNRIQKIQTLQFKFQMANGSILQQTHLL